MKKFSFMDKIGTRKKNQYISIFLFFFYNFCSLKNLLYLIDGSLTVKIQIIDIINMYRCH
jgi:hypothetical protein